MAGTLRPKISGRIVFPCDPRRPVLVIRVLYKPLSDLVYIHPLPLPFLVPTENAEEVSLVVPLPPRLHPTDGEPLGSTRINIYTYIFGTSSTAPCLTYVIIHTSNTYVANPHLRDLGLVVPVYIGTLKPGEEIRGVRRQRGGV